jgi:hypothetical protein
MGFGLECWTILKKHLKYGLIFVPMSPMPETAPVMTLLDELFDEFVRGEGDIEKLKIINKCVGDWLHQARKLSGKPAEQGPLKIRLNDTILDQIEECEQLLVTTGSEATQSHLTTLKNLYERIWGRLEKLKSWDQELVDSISASRNKIIGSVLCPKNIVPETKKLEVRLDYDALNRQLFDLANSSRLFSGSEVILRIMDQVVSVPEGPHRIQLSKTVGFLLNAIRLGDDLGFLKAVWQKCPEVLRDEKMFGTMLNAAGSLKDLNLVRAVWEACPAVHRTQIQCQVRERALKNCETRPQTLASPVPVQSAPTTRRETPQKPKAVLPASELNRLLRETWINAPAASRDAALCRKVFLWALGEQDSEIQKEVAQHLIDRGSLKTFRELFLWCSDETTVFLNATLNTENSPEAAAYLAFQMGEHEKALNLLKKKGQGENTLLAAECLILQKKYEEALVILKGYLVDQPKASKVGFARAICFLFSGDGKAAREVIGQILKTLELEGSSGTDLALLSRMIFEWWIDLRFPDEIEDQEILERVAEILRSGLGSVSSKIEREMILGALLMREYITPSVSPSKSPSPRRESRAFAPTSTS